MFLSKRIALALAATALLPVAHAGAADYDPPVYVEPAEEYVPVEIGSGWYLRGDVAYNFSRRYKDRSLSVDDSLFDNDLVGWGTIGAFDIFSFRESESPISGSIGFGYHFNDYLRGDVNIGVLADDKYSGSAHMSAGYLNPFRTVDSLSPAVWQTPDFGCLGTREVTASTTTTTVDADGNTVVGEPVVNSVVNPSWSRDCMVNATVKNSAWNGLANGYIDLGTYAGITPYVGAGLGVLYTRTKISSEAICEANSTSQTLSTGSESTTTTSTFLCRGQSSPSDAAVTYTPASYRKSNYNFMYSLAAGLSYQVSKNTSLDFGYQYIDAPDVKYYSVSADGIERHKGISTNQFKIGVRYDLW